MSKSLYLYSTLPVKELARVVKTHQEEFDVIVGDTFSEEELLQHEKLLDAIASVEVQPILAELSFEDFYPDKNEEVKQKFFFESCVSSVCLDNLPYFESNPFQVTYLINLLWCFDEVLIDQGGVSELSFKKPYIDTLKKFKTMDSLISDSAPKPIEVKTKKPVNPIDFLILDVYKELSRLKSLERDIPINEQAEKLQKIYLAMREEHLDADALLKKSGLIPKDFGDNLERLKFFLRKI